MNQSTSSGAGRQDTPHPSVRYAAVIHNIQEVTLTGAADLTFWREALRREALFPFNVNSSAEITISAPRLAWKGFRFCELSVAISVAQGEDASQPDGLFLAHAFNTSPLLAFAERTFFSTPYFAADIQVEAAMPASVTLTQGDTRVFCAHMIVQPPLLRSGDELWEGPIFLPRAHAQAPRKRFMASLGGDTHTYAFSTGSDVLELNPTRPNDIFSQLRDSGFAAHAWHIRQRATHAKSRTLSD